MAHPIDRRTADLSAYPDLVVIYLGMRANRLAGIRTLLGFGPKIGRAAAAMPDGLLRHEPIHGFTAFAPTHEARGPMFSARNRLQLAGESESAAPVTERELDH